MARRVHVDLVVVGFGWLGYLAIAQVNSAL